MTREGRLFNKQVKQVLFKNRTCAVWVDQHIRNWRILDRAEEKLKANGLNVYQYPFLNKERVFVYSKDFYSAFRDFKRNFSPVF